MSEKIENYSSDFANKIINGTFKIDKIDGLTPQIGKIQPSLVYWHFILEYYVFRLKHTIEELITILNKNQPEFNEEKFREKMKPFMKYEKIIFTKEKVEETFGVFEDEGSICEIVMACNTCEEYVKINYNENINEYVIYCTDCTKKGLEKGTLMECPHCTCIFSVNEIDEHELDFDYGENNVAMFSPITVQIICPNEDCNEEIELTYQIMKEPETHYLIWDFVIKEGKHLTNQGLRQICQTYQDSQDFIENCVRSGYFSIRIEELKILESQIATIGKLKNAYLHKNKIDLYVITEYCNQDFVDKTPKKESE